MTIFNRWLDLMLNVVEGVDFVTSGSELNGTYLSRYGLLLEEMSAAGKPPSSLHGRIHGVFRKK
jgi:hypothetical protein